jgi:long-chain fatty acid transport protein
MMSKAKFLFLLLAGFLVLGASGALAAGFNIYEAGVKATGLGGAFTATADDGSAMFYNPAGISFQQGSAISMNLMPIGPRFKFQGAVDGNGPGEFAQVEKKWYLVPGAYYTNSMNDKVAFGVGVYAPFGLGVVWKDPKNFVGRYVSYDVGIQTVYVTPAISYKVTPELAVAVGADVAHQHLSLKRITPHPMLGDNAIDLEIDGSSKFNFTPSFGVMYRPHEQLSFGFMYHHEKTMEFEDQDATLTSYLNPGDPGYSWPSTLIESLGGNDQTISSELSLPYIMSLGAAYQVSPRIRVEGNYVHFGWSAFESLEMDFSNDDLDQTIHFDYEDAWQVRFGLNYEAIPDELNLLVGFVHDTTPQPTASVSPLLPDADRDDYSLGFQYHKDSWEFSACYMFVKAKERSNIENGRPANPDEAYPVGTYRNIANIWGVGVGYHF